MGSPGRNSTENVNKLLKEFRSGAKLTISEIQALLGCNRRSAYNYLERIKKSGNGIIEDNKRPVHYALEKTENSVLEEYKPLNYDHLRKFTILRVLQNSPVRSDSFRKRFSIYDNRNILSEVSLSKALLDVQLTGFYALLKDLKETGEIAVIKDHYYPTGKTIPVELYLDEDDLYNLDVELSNAPPGLPYYSDIKSLRDKLSYLIEPEDDSSENYLIYGNKNGRTACLKKQIEYLNSFDFQHKVLKIEYQTRDKGIRSTWIAVGMLVYSEEKDAFYIMGESGADNSYSPKRPVIINMATIISIQETQTEHTAFNSAEYEKLFENMFSISVEPPEAVEILFDDTASIYRKLEQLQKHRKYSGISRKDGKIMYTDQVSGLNDLSVWLRRFGRGAAVQKPKRLKDQFETSILRSLQRYEETEYEI